MAEPAMSGMTPLSAHCGWTAIVAVLSSLLCMPAAVAQSAQPQAAPAESGTQSETYGPAAPPLSQIPSSPQGSPSPQGPPSLQVLPLPQAQPLPPVQSPQAANPGDASKPEGFFDVLNRWMDKSAKDFKSSVDESNAKWREFGEKSDQAAKEAAAAQKEAAEAFKNLSNVRIVEGRQTCTQAPNGSPDCQVAAEVICRGKGFGKGQSADIQTTRKCSAKAFITRNERECRTETVVVKAACQ